MKNIKIALLLFGTFTMTITGCKRQTCYNCYHYWGAFECSKNGHTYTSNAIFNWQWLQDSVNLYKSQGYTIDTVGGYYLALGIICDTNPGPFAVNPDSCVFSHYKY